MFFIFHMSEEIWSICFLNFSVESPIKQGKFTWKKEQTKAEEDMIEDLKEMGIRTWVRKAQDRKECAEIFR